MSSNRHQERILFVKIGALGDVIMASRILPVLERERPGTQLVWICGKLGATYLRTLQVSNLTIIELDEGGLFSKSKLRQVRTILRTWQGLPMRQYGLVAIGHSDWRYATLGWPVWAKTRRSFSSPRGLIPGRYHGDEYVRLIMGHDGPGAIHRVSGFPMPLPESTPVRLDSELILMPGGAKNSLSNDPQRRWPVACYRQLAEGLLDQGYRVVLAGSASDTWVLPEFRAILPRVENLIGTTDLVQLILRIKRAGAVVTHDSGPMHLGFATRTPTIALFGPTLASEKIPPEDRARVMELSTPLSCCPCYDGKTYSPCQLSICMERIHPSQVLARIREILVARPNVISNPGGSE